MGWPAAIGMLLVSLGIGYALSSYALGSRVIGPKSASPGPLRAVFPVLAVVLFFLTADFVLPSPRTDQGSAVFSLALTFFLWGYFAALRLHSSTAGALLLDLGSLGQRRPLCLLAGAFNALVAVMHLAEIPGGHTLRELASSAVYLSGAVIFLMLGQSRFELRENGILHLSQLIRWQDIASYTWEQQEDEVLVLRRRGWPPFWDRAMFRPVRVPPDQKENVDRILAQRISRTPPEASTGSQPTI